MTWGLWVREQAGPGQSPWSYQVGHMPSSQGQCGERQPGLTASLTQPPIRVGGQQKGCSIHHIRPCSCGISGDEKIS